MGLCRMLSSRPWRSRALVDGVVPRDYTRAMIVTVRQAKAQLSRLLDEVAAGDEVIISCNGKPKARLVGLAASHVAFRVNWKLLRGRRRAGKRARPAEELIRQDRDSRD